VCERERDRERRESKDFSEMRFLYLSFSQKNKEKRGQIETTEATTSIR